MIAPNVAALTRCVTTRQVKEAVQLGGAVCDRQLLPTAKPAAAKAARQAAPPQQERRNPTDSNVLPLNATLGNRSLNSI